MEPGTKVGRYRVERELGRSVWLATDPALRRKVAIELVREPRPFARVPHPCIVAIHDTGVVDGTPYVVMEYVDGPSLAHWLAEAPRSWRDIVAIFVEVARGLAAAHASRVVHGALAADRVLVVRDRHAKVTGLGTRPATEADDQQAFVAALGDALATAHDRDRMPDLAATQRPSMQAVARELQRLLVPAGHRTLAFGLPPSADASAKREYTAELARVLGERFGQPISVAFAADYRALVGELVAGRHDAAWLSPLGLIGAERQARPLLALQRGGRSTYQSALCARRDAGIVGLHDLRGKRIGWVDPDSAAGYVLARALIAEQHPDIDAYLGPQQVLGSHRAVVEAVRDGSVDAGATFLNFGPDGAIIRSGWHEFLGERADELCPIAIGPGIGADVIAARTNLPRGESAPLVAALHDLAADPTLRPLLAEVFNGADAFVEPDATAYDALAAQAQRAGWRP